MNCVELIYMYRDGGNFKHPGGVYLAGVANRADKMALDEACYRNKLFIPQQVGLPMVAPWVHNWREFDDDLDDVWHEFCQLENVSDIPPQQIQCSLGEMIEKFERAGREGWNDQEPMEWYGCEGRVNIFEEAVGGERFHVLNSLLDAHQKPNLPGRAAQKLYQHYRNEEQPKRAAQLLGLSEQLVQQLKPQDLMWLLQHSDPQIRHTAIRGLRNGNDPSGWTSNRVSISGRGGR